MIRRRLRAAVRAIGRAALDGMATENGWCWVWGFGPVPLFMYKEQRGQDALRAASAAPAAASDARSSAGSSASTSPASPTS